MSDEPSISTVVQIYDSLRAFARFEGSMRSDSDLLSFLQGSGLPLCRALNINVNNGAKAAWRTISLALTGHVEQIKVRVDHQPLTPEERDEQYRFAVLVCFDMSQKAAKAGLQEKTLQGRMRWLDEAARGKRRIKVRTCQRDFDHACKQIAVRLGFNGNSTKVVKFEDLQAEEADRKSLEEKVVKIFMEMPESVNLGEGFW